MQVIAVVLVLGLALVGVVVLAVSERPRRHEGHRRAGAAEITREQARAAAQVYQNHSGGI